MRHGELSVRTAFGFGVGLFAAGRCLVTTTRGVLCGPAPSAAGNNPPAQAPPAPAATTATTLTTATRLHRRGPGAPVTWVSYRHAL